MAEPITKINRIQMSQGEIKQKDLQQVIDVVSENKDAIIKGIKLLTTIEKNGTLDFMNALVLHKEDALRNIMQELNKEQYAGTLENASDLMFLLGELDLRSIKRFMNKINEGMKEALTIDENDHTSYMGMLKALKEPEVNRSITMLLTLLRKVGSDKN